MILTKAAMTAARDKYPMDDDTTTMATLTVLLREAFAAGYIAGYEAGMD